MATIPIPPQQSNLNNITIPLYKGQPFKQKKKKKSSSNRRSPYVEPQQDYYQNIESGEILTKPVGSSDSFETVQPSTIVLNTNQATGRQTLSKLSNRPPQIIEPKTYTGSGKPQQLPRGQSVIDKAIRTKIIQSSLRKADSLLGKGYERTNELYNSLSLSEDIRKLERQQLELERQNKLLEINNGQVSDSLIDYNPPTIFTGGGTTQIKSYAPITDENLKEEPITVVGDIVAKRKFEEIERDTNEKVEQEQIRFKAEQDLIDSRYSSGNLSEDEWIKLSNDNLERAFTNVELIKEERTNLYNELDLDFKERYRKNIVKETGIEIVGSMPADIIFGAGLGALGATGTVAGLGLAGYGLLKESPSLLGKSKEEYLSFGARTGASFLFGGLGARTTSGYKTKTVSYKTKDSPIDYYQDASTLFFRMTKQEGDNTVGNLQGTTIIGVYKGKNKLFDIEARTNQIVSSTFDDMGYGKSKDIGYTIIPESQQTKRLGVKRQNLKSELNIGGGLFITDNGITSFIGGGKSRLNKKLKVEDVPFNSFGVDTINPNVKTGGKSFVASSIRQSPLNNNLYSFSSLSFSKPTSVKVSGYISYANLNKYYKFGNKGGGILNYAKRVSSYERKASKNIKYKRSEGFGIVKVIDETPQDKTFTLQEGKPKTNQVQQTNIGNALSKGAAQVNLQLSDLISKLPKTIKTKVKETKVTTKYRTPTTRFGYGNSQDYTKSSFAGTGQYERTEYLGFNNISKPVKEVNTNVDLISGKFNNQLSINQNMQQRERYSSGSKNKNKKIEEKIVSQINPLISRVNSVSNIRDFTRQSNRLQQRQQQANAFGLNLKLNTSLPRPVKITREQTPPRVTTFVKDYKDNKSRFGYGFLGYVKFGKTEQRVTDKPLSYSDAFNVASRITDTTLAKSFRLVPTKKIVRETKTQTPLAYKFRTFKQVRGKRVPQKLTFIEKRKYSLEEGEQTTIRPLKVRGIKQAASKRRGSLGLF